MTRKRSVTMAVRGKGEKELADRYFCETLVRVHRQGEGKGPEGHVVAHPESGAPHGH